MVSLSEMRAITRSVTSCQFKFSVSEIRGKFLIFEDFEGKLRELIACTIGEINSTK